MRNFTITLGLLMVIIIIGFIVLASPVTIAATNTPAPTEGTIDILPSCIADGRCGLCDIVQTGVNIGRFILSIVGAVVLLMFIYGGFLMLISGGNTDKIQKGKSILTNSIIGLAITLFAYTIITFAVNAVTIDTKWTWEGKLTCAPLPSEIKYTTPDRNAAPTNAPATIPPKSVANGGDCKTSTQCVSGLCRPKTNPCTTSSSGDGTCVDKYATGVLCGTGCGLAIANNDQCISKNCNITTSAPDGSWHRGSCQP